MSDSNKTLTDFLAQVDHFVNQGDWQGALNSLQSAAVLAPGNRDILTGIGSVLIQLGRAEEAVSYFKETTTLSDVSAQAFINLGLAHLLSGQYQSAEQAYRRAAAIDDENVQAWKGLAQALLQQGSYLEGVEILAALVKANPNDDEALVMMAQCYEDSGDLTSARTMYQQALRLNPEYLLAKEGLQRLPDPERIARPEHAQKLAALKGLIKKPSAQVEQEISTPTDIKKVAFYGPAEAAVETRLGPLAKGLLSAGHTVKISVNPDLGDVESFDTFVFSRPHASDAFLNAMQNFANAGKRVVLDIDQDYRQMPAGYADYDRLGPGNPAALQALEKALELADIVTTASKELQERYSGTARKASVLPYTLDQANPLWQKASPPRRNIHLGLLATHTHPEDVAVMGDSLKRVLDEYPNTLLVVAAGYPLYESFGDISDERKLFLPSGRLDDYPYLFSEFDILLYPFIDHPYNHARSDLPALEAAVRGLPWVATPLEAFDEWRGGGLTASNPEEWFNALHQLVDNRELRFELGAEGRKLSVDLCLCLRSYNL